MVRQTLEAAISSSVRLCVVAPTVNVHVSNRSAVVALRFITIHSILVNPPFLYTTPTHLHPHPPYR